MNGHDIIWTQPPALLSGAAAHLLPGPRQALQRPAILRFNNDTFMQEFLGVLDADPGRLREYQVRRETWRGFMPAPVHETPKTPSLVLRRLGILPRRAPAGVASATPSLPATESVPAGTPLKLYQPAHQRHYLVASSLVCKVTGLPDRGVEPGRGEQTGCVIRRLLPPAATTTLPVEDWDEYAWVARPQGHVWQHVGVDPLKVVDDEERLPLFAVQFAESERRRRRLFAGVIPVGRREAYLGAPKSGGGTGATAGLTARTARKILLRKEVVEPWKTLVRRAQGAQKSFLGPFFDGYEPPAADQKVRRLRSEREQIQTISWFILLDFAKYLSTYLKPVWRAVLDPSRRDDLLDPEGALFDALASARISDGLREAIRRDAESVPPQQVLYSLSSVPSTLREALAKFGAGIDGIDTVLEQQLEGIDRDYVRADATSRGVWPGFLFPLADPDAPSDAPLPPATALAALNGEEQDELTLDAGPAANDPLVRLDKLTVLVLRALRDDHAEPAPEPSVPAAAVAPANALEGWFVIRCVYERPGCEPLHNAITSDPTEPFQMAGFFDPDAPARPIRIGLPIDTSPGGLRKFDKNTAFVISDTLCGQIGRLKGLTLGDLVLSVLPWPFHKDLPSLGTEGGPCKTDGGLSLGMICSLSIPIVTICALILLIIMVSLFDFLFKWLPYFIICFPLPGLKAKK
jgi:hypothetical protein